MRGGSVAKADPTRQGRTAGLNGGEIGKKHRQGRTEEHLLASVMREKGKGEKWERLRLHNPDVWFPMPLFETITGLKEGAETLRRRPYGVIEVADGRLRRIILRPFPKIVSAPGILLFGHWRHQHRSGDLLRLYYNQPWRFRNFLVLKYIESACSTSIATVNRALAVLDEIARYKRSDALLCDVSNWRVTTKLIGRWGWVPHCPSRFHRHYIKRFYGCYPAPVGHLSASELGVNELCQY
jgi:hypothetical protein